MRLLIAGGGSGGHVQPGLAVAAALRRQRPDVQLDWLGTAGNIEERLVPAAGIPLHTIQAGKLNRFVAAQTARDLARVPVGLLQALAVVRRLAPDAVLTCGGFVAVPAGVAAWATGQPLLALQQDVEPNLANRLIAPFAGRIGVAFAASLTHFPPGKAVFVGNPLRASILNGDATEGRRRFDPPNELPLVVVTGGSQGALQLNRLVVARLARWLEQAAVLHLCGDPSVPLVQQAAATLPERLRSRYVWRPFLDDGMGDALAAADLVVSRAGASTLAELAALRKAAILVPLPPPVGRSPQEANARTFARAGAAVVWRESDLDPDRLFDAVRVLLGDPVRRAQMAKRAGALGRPDAAERVASLLLETARAR